MNTKFNFSICITIHIAVVPVDANKALSQKPFGIRHMSIPTFFSSQWRIPSFPKILTFLVNHPAHLSLCSERLKLLQSWNSTVTLLTGRETHKDTSYKASFWFIRRTPFTAVTSRGGECNFTQRTEIRRRMRKRVYSLSLSLSCQGSNSHHIHLTKYRSHTYRHNHQC